MTNWIDIIQSGADKLLVVIAVRTRRSRWAETGSCLVYHFSEQELYTASCLLWKSLSRWEHHWQKCDDNNLESKSQDTNRTGHDSQFWELEKYSLNTSLHILSLGALTSSLDVNLEAPQRLQAEVVFKWLWPDLRSRAFSSNFAPQFCLAVGW